MPQLHIHFKVVRLFKASLIRVDKTSYFRNMETKSDIPFQQLLAVVKALTPSQKAKLKQELSEEDSAKEDKSAFIEMLLKGPVYSEKDI